MQYMPHHHQRLAPGKKRRGKQRVMGIFALQLIKGVSKIVICRSRSEARVRVAMTAGTLQPKPMSIGTILRPESPIFRSSLSITKAIRAI